MSLLHFMSGMIKVRTFNFLGSTWNENNGYGQILNDIIEFAKIFMLCVY